MAGWEAILEECRAAGSAHDVVRRRYLRKLGTHRKRNIIAYYSGWLQKPHLARDHGDALSISDTDKNGFMSVIHGMDRDKGCDLILHTPGGDLAATESLVDYLAHMFSGNVEAFVPQLAMSGGTILALSCKSIVMGKHSSIGPIDPQYRGMAVAGILEEIRRAKAEIQADPSSALLWQPILSQLRPGDITEFENAVEWSRNMAARYLAANMFNGDPDVTAKVAAIVPRLVEPDETITHGRHIGFDEARDIFGDKIIEMETDPKLQDAVLSVHHSMIVSLQATNAVKIIENQKGKAFILAAQVQAVAATPTP